MRYERLSDWLEWQEELHPKPIDLGLERVLRVCEYCDILPRAKAVIGIAGTNGKGSTVALLEEIFRCAGYVVGTYTSPHLRRYNERIRIRGVPVSDRELCEAFDFIDRHRRGISLSFFEFGTLAAFYCFKFHPLDVILLEAGLGGRLDAINIAALDATIITSIGMDHVEWLGTTREDIAREKSGVMRSANPVICGDPVPPKAIVETARKKGAVLYQLGEHFHFEREGDSWRFVCEDGRIENLPLPALPGRVQLQNAACALMAVQCLREQLPVADEAKLRGLEGVRLEGRFQVRKKHTRTIILDVAHNPPSVAVLVENLIGLPTVGYTHVVFSVLVGKDVGGMLEQVAPLVDYWHLAEVQASRALRIDVLHEQVKGSTLSAPVKVHGSIPDACRYSLSQLGENDRLLVFGSTIAVAEALDSGL